MYSSVLLPKSFERPGPKSVSPAMNCSGVEVVVSWKWSVAMDTPRPTSYDHVSRWNTLDDGIGCGAEHETRGHRYHRLMDSVPPFLSNPNPHPRRGDGHDDASKLPTSDARHRTDVSHDRWTVRSL